MLNHLNLFLLLFLLFVLLVYVLKSCNAIANTIEPINNAPNHANGLFANLEVPRSTDGTLDETPR